MKYFHYAVSIVGCLLSGASAKIFFDHSRVIAQSASSEAVWATLFLAILGLVFVSIGIFGRLNDRLKTLESLLKDPRNGSR